MKNTFIILLILITGCTTQQVNSALGALGQTGDAPLTSTDVTNGLKEALVQGISNGTAIASKTDGYLKNPQLRIPFPPEAQKVEDKLRQIGLGGEVDKFITSLNRGAERAALKAKPIFVNAIKSMTIDDAWGILKGEDNAATNYLRRTTGDQLYQSFNPVISKTLEEVNATKYYDDIVNTYNKIPFVEKVNPDLDDYATKKAMEGLFLLIEKEEEKIRKDPVARATELLKRVFAEQD